MRRLRHNPGAVRAGETLLETSKIVATIAVAAAIGVGAGKGISSLTDEPAAPKVPAVGATQTTPSAALPISVRVTFAGLRPPGEAGERGRLRVGVRLRNRSDRRVSVEIPRIQVGEDLVRAEAGPDSLVSRLRAGLAPSASATGELRFQTGEATTRRLIALRRTTLLIGRRRIAVRFDVAEAEPPPEAATAVPPGAGTTTPVVP